jgi:hypothetical protein
MSHKSKKPILPDLKKEHTLKLVKIVAKMSRLPNAETVRSFESAVFPTVRNSKKRISRGKIGNQKIMYDDNTTPRWALLWSHGISNTGHPKGWTIAHVWSVSKDPSAYTNLANLLLIPEYLSGLSDKKGPLVEYLQYHAWHKYKWTPKGISKPKKPFKFDDIKWNYMSKIESPHNFIEVQISRLKNQRVKLLRKI